METPPIYSQYEQNKTFIITSEHKLLIFSLPWDYYKFKYHSETLSHIFPRCVFCSAKYETV